MPRKAVTSDEIARPVGPFYRRCRWGICLVERQVAQSPTTGELIAGDVAAQTEPIFQNLRAVLRAAGKTLADVMKVKVYLTDIKDFARMNAVYERHFEVPHPARTTVAVVALPLGAAGDIELIAR